MKENKHSLIDLTTKGIALSKEQLEKYNISLEKRDHKADRLSWLIDTQDPAFSEKYNEAQQKNAQIIAISSDPDETNVLETMKQYDLSHITGESSYLTDEIITNVLKYQLQNIWGPEKYLDEGALLSSEELFHSRDAKQVVDVILEGIDFTPFFDGPKNYIKVIYNELLTNAFYHMQDLASRNRTESIFVGHEDSIELKLGLDEQKLAISVRDHNKPLSKEQIISSLQRSFREKRPNNRTPGAGLGLYFVFHHANQLIFNCSIEHGNEIIAIIDVNKRYLNYKKRTTSFHYFYEA